MESDKRAYLYIHFAVILWSFTAILGKLITLSEYVLVWYRMLLTAIILLFLPGVLKDVFKFGFKRLLPLMGIGAIVSLHWVAFYGSIKYTNASVAVACLGTTSIFAAILEPLLSKTPFRRVDLLLGAGMSVAIYLISNASPSGFAFGIGLGIISALFASIFSILNKKYAHQYPALLFTFAEMAGGWILLCLILPFYIAFMPGHFIWPSYSDWGLLGLLAIFCTVLPFSLSIIALRRISAFTSVFIINLEPLYTLALAAVIFKEHDQLSLNFYLGTLLMLVLISAHSLLLRRKQKSVVQV